MLICLLGEEFSLGPLRSVFSAVEMVREGEFLLEYTPGMRFPASASGRVGLASSRFVAQCAARLTPQGSCLQVIPGNEAEFLAPLGVSFLPAEAETLRRLDLLGIKTMGQLMGLGKDPLYQLFGKEGLRIWEYAQGIDERPLLPSRVPHLPEAEHDFEDLCPGGVWLERVLAGLMTALFEQLCGTLCMGVVVELFLDGGDFTSFEVLFAVGTSKTEVALGQLQQKLSSLQLSAPIVSVQVRVKAVATAVSEELSLFTSRYLSKLRSQLSAKGKPAALMQLVWTEPQHRLPERRAYLQSLLQEEVTRPVYVPKPISLDEGCIEAVLEEWDVVDQWWTLAPIERHYMHAYFKTGARRRLFYQEHQWYQQ